MTAVLPSGPYRESSEKIDMGEPSPKAFARTSAATTSAHRERAAMVVPYWTDSKGKNALGVLWMPGGMEMGPDGEAMPVPSRSYVLVWDGSKLVEAGP